MEEDEIERQRQIDVDAMTLAVAEGTVNVECAKARLHAKYCEPCRKLMAEK